ncbi:MAG: allophanate hydrolase [Pseudomonadota bacterium]
MTLGALRAALRQGARPAEVMLEVYHRIDALNDPGVFLYLLPRDEALLISETLGEFDETKPLWGIPFAVKDNIDVAGMPTTAACPAYAYDAETDAFAVARLRAAGAIPIGKTNLDQFATGLVGTRTPHPVPKNPLDPKLVPGGSSSGSAVAVAAGLVPFSLGTDTAGSGRVPAALNNIVGLKPSLGAISTQGVVPACRTLDCVSVFALTVEDAFTVFQQAAGHCPEDPYSRKPTIGTPGALPPDLTIAVPDARSRQFFGDMVQAATFAEHIGRLKSLGAQIEAIDLAPFFAAAEMLYDGPWVAERHAVIEPLLAQDANTVHPVVRDIVSGAAKFSATDTFRAIYELNALRRRAQKAMAGIDLICVPSIPTFYTSADLEDDPLGPNTALGTYTNFVNLLELCALTVPMPERADGRPGSVTLLGRDGADALLASLGAVLQQFGSRRLGATDWPVPASPEPPSRARDGEMEIVVCGAHMSGLPLNGELTSRGGRFLRATKTRPAYRLYRLPGGPPVRPGMVRNAEGGPIAVEVWTLPSSRFGDFIAGIPAPLCIGTVDLADGTAPKGFLCEAHAVAGAEDVTAIGNWRHVRTKVTA